MGMVGVWMVSAGRSGVGVIYLSFYVAIYLYLCSKHWHTHNMQK